MEKREGLIFLNNLKESLRTQHYFIKENTVCRNIDKVIIGIKNGFDEKN